MTASAWASMAAAKNARYSASVAGLGPPCSLRLRPLMYWQIGALQISYPNTKSRDQLKGVVAVWPRRKLPSSCQELRRQLFQFLQPSQHRVAAASSLSTGGKYGLIQDHS